jgi:demethylmenaquinone methyltransferase/2-methoxy-6-polyprenyl-1,4-benzoquinol methylase
MTSMDEYACKLQLSDFLREDLFRAVIRELRLPQASRGLDVGCGIGSHTVLLVEALGPGSHVTGLDRSTQLLDRARKHASARIRPNQVAFQHGDLRRLPFEDDCFDWAWSVDCLGYAPGDPLPSLREVSRVVRPGGQVAILGWSSQQLLPGYPRLEARLNATSLGTAPFGPGMRPESHFLRALGWFSAVGLTDARAKAFVGDVHAPLSDDVRRAMISLFEMRWGDPHSELDEEDWKEYRRLCRPDSPDCILKARDYYAFFVYSLFSGTVPEN